MPKFNKKRSGGGPFLMKSPLRDNKDVVIEEMKDDELRKKKINPAENTKYFINRKTGQMSTTTTTKKKPPVKNYKKGYYGA